MGLWRSGFGGQGEHGVGEAGELGGGDDVRWHGVEQAAERAEPDAHVHKAALGGGHVDGAFELNDADGAEHCLLYTSPSPRDA